MAYRSVTGWCWPQSVRPGGRVALHLSSPGGRPVAVEVARVGRRRQVMWSATVEAADHDTPPDAPEHGCRWPAAATIDVGADWTSGYHEVVLRVEIDGRSRTDHAFFVVGPRPDSPATILMALATNTWHAYNDFGGRNLYTGATQSSLQRPMARGYLAKPPGAGRRVTTVHPPDPEMNTHVGYLRRHHLSGYAGSAGWPDWEQPFLAWAEREGYAIDVCTNADLHEDPALLGRYRLLLSVGHDEYWSAGMRDTVEAHIGRGGHAAFLSGNTAFWQVRLEDPTPAGPHATMVGYKGRFRDDPVFGTDRQGELTTIWSDALLGRPENQMTGVSFVHGGYHRIGRRVTNGAGAYTVHRPDHWLFEGTDLGYGDLLGAASTVVGYECDGCELTLRDGLPVPTHADGTPESFEVLATAPAAHFTRETATRPPRPDEPSEIEFIASRVFATRDPAAVARIAAGHAVLGSWTSPAGGTVVTTGCTDWAHGLTGLDPAVERITANILDRLGRR